VCVFVVLVIQHALRMHRAVIFGLFRSSTFYYERNDFRKKKLLKTNVLIFSTALNLRRNERDMTTNVYWASSKVTIILVRF